LEGERPIYPRPLTRNTVAAGDSRVTHLEESSRHARFRSPYVGVLPHFALCASAG